MAATGEVAAAKPEPAGTGTGKGKGKGGGSSSSQRKKARARAKAKAKAEAQAAAAAAVGASAKEAPVKADGNGAKAGKPKKASKPAVTTPDANWRQLLANGGAAVGKKRKRTGRAQIRDKPRAEDKPALAIPVIDWTKRKAAPLDRGGEARTQRVVALDCEMVGVGTSGSSSALARVCVVNEEGHVLLDSYATPMEKVTDYRTKYSGIRKEDLVGAPTFWKVRDQVADLVRGNVLVGHALKNDLEVLQLKHPAQLLRDTARYAPMRKADANGVLRSAKLKDVAARELGVVIQNGEHDPYVDARAALEIYKKHRVEWEAELVKRRRETKKARELRRVQHKTLPAVAVESSRLLADGDGLAEASAAAPAAESAEAAPEAGDIFRSRRFKRHKRDKA